ncbi:MAG: RluA family pseudouridine synthase [Candidatus Omnitrophota bacterium]|nr:RluA family pseudouridine synthase [Candidatus Omnitrophota bacterium]
MKQELIVSLDNSGTRLDFFLSKNVESISRTKINELIKKGNVLVDGKVKKPSYILKDNQTVCLSIVEDKSKDFLKPFKLDIPIIFEDDDILIINKPHNLVVHPPQPGINTTLVNALIYMKKELSDLTPLRPGVVHRLDKETSGVMVLAKNNSAYLNIVSQFKARKVKKEYLAVCWGRVIKEKIVVDLPLSRDTKNRLKMKVSFTKSKNAYTEIEVLKRFDDATFLKIKPLTGRMHQIRVHLKFLGYPIVGDKKYGIKDSFSDLLLHAHKLGIYHPSKGYFIEFTAPIPVRFNDFMKNKHTFSETEKS